MAYEYDWKNHFELSREMHEYLRSNMPIADSGRVAAISRTIIHLTYYSCLHITKENNIKYGLENQETGHGAHDRNIRKISKYKTSIFTKEELRILEADLLQLKKYRTSADYKSGHQIDYHYINNIFKDADDIYNKLIVL